LPVIYLEKMRKEPTYWNFAGIWKTMK